MIFVFGGLKYDTDKMEKVAEVKKSYKNTTILGSSYWSTYNCTLYKSAKGNWLLTHQDGGNYGQAIEENEAKDLLLRYDIKKYEEMYGELPEA